jgi:hypothetical protein
MARCFSCGSLLPDKIYRTTVCPVCDKDAKVCLNCAFYEKGAQWDCREKIDEPVREKERANFCGFFEPEKKRRETSAGTGTKEGGGKAVDAKRAFLGLFGDDT